MVTNAKTAGQTEQPHTAMCVEESGRKRPRMLVPIDCSEFGDTVLETAVCTARLLNADVHLVAVVAPEHEQATVQPLATWYPSYDGEAWNATERPRSIVIEWRDQALHSSRSAVEDYLHRTAERFAGLQVTTQILMRRSVGDAIVDYARESEIDLIAMATHGRRRFAQALLGSIAAEVVRSGVAPALLVKPKEA